MQIFMGLFLHTLVERKRKEDFDCSIGKDSISLEADPNSSNAPSKESRSRKKILPIQQDQNRCPAAAVAQRHCIAS